MSGYRQGRDVEYAVIHHLAENGYDTIRAASSKGLADVCAFKPGQGLLVNCKRSRMPGPAERADLIRISRLLPGLLPLVALKPPREPLMFRLLTGYGASDWTPWTADFIPPELKENPVTATQQPTLWRKKPVVIEAMQYQPDRINAIWDWAGAGNVYGPVEDDQSAYITTLEGRMEARPGDWIIRGVQGEFYPCKPGIFEATYETAEEP